MRRGTFIAVSFCLCLSLIACGSGDEIVLEALQDPIDIEPDNGNRGKLVFKTASLKGGTPEASQHSDTTPPYASGRNREVRDDWAEADHGWLLYAPIDERNCRVDRVRYDVNFSGSKRMLLIAEAGKVEVHFGRPDKELHIDRVCDHTRNRSNPIKPECNGNGLPAKLSSPALHAGQKLEVLPAGADPEDPANWKDAAWIRVRCTDRDKYGDRCIDKPGSDCW